MKTILRQAVNSDLEDIYQLALDAGFGLTTLSKSKAELKERINISTNSFKKKLAAPLNENYLFVLEDVENNKIVGTSAIEASVGHSLPFYAYRVSKVSNICHKLNLRVNYNVLILNNDLQGMTELGTLYLAPSHRNNKNGLLLSKARFLFMGLMPNRFSKDVIAEMRGVSDSEGNSPFWDSLGKHFFKMSFNQADELSVLTNKQFISDLLPQHPVHANLLSKQAQEAIGQPHKSTIPAMKILLNEGFYPTDYIDIFDAGPAIQAKVCELSSIRNKQTFIVRALVDEIKGEAYLVSNTKANFKAMYITVLIDTKGAVLLSGDAKLLEVNINDSIQLVKI